MSRTPSPQEHLGDRLSDYVDRVLPVDALLAADRHLVACLSCRAGADEERRLLASLRRSDLPAGGHAALQRMLVGLASQAAAPQSAVDAQYLPRRLEVLPRSAPAMHRSARHSVACAGLTVAACAVAAWALGTGQAIVPRPVTPFATTPAAQSVDLAPAPMLLVSWSEPAAP